MVAFVDITPREYELVEAVVKGALEYDTDHRLTVADKRLLRKLYKKGYINAEAVLWVDGPPHDILSPNEKSREIVESMEKFRAEAGATTPRPVEHTGPRGDKAPA